MKEINFITSNTGKVETLKNVFSVFGFDVKIIQLDLDIIEPQIDSIKEISRSKALQAFDILKKPVLVEDGGLEIKSLNNFPSAYTKYITESIGVDGILKLMQDIEDRSGVFTSWATFINEKGEIFQFEKDRYEFTITTEKSGIESEFAWSELWQVIYFPEYQKTLSEMNKHELDDYYEKIKDKGSIQKFAKWYVDNYQ